MKNLHITHIFIALCLMLTLGINTSWAQPAKKILVMGDSMTGWMGERLNSYGKANGFEVATIVWDGSTIKKWGASADKVKKYVDEIDPDAVIICLGLNECAERNPETQLGKSLTSILDAVGERPLLWVGPPSWPGKDYGEPFNSWLSESLGADRYFYSHDLKLPRQSATNPHPTREGINEWTDEIVDWIPPHAEFSLPGYSDPTSAPSRGQIFIYRKMKDNL
ncbi:MAG: SGNH/GDSL hydrolase family protein [Muribaculaceae bacterium]|nr:SGNH/GDSL hydrolase family protein [Muribaculaceae bacterium]